MITIRFFLNKLWLIVYLEGKEVNNYLVFYTTLEYFGALCQKVYLLQRAVGGSSAPFGGLWPFFWGLWPHLDAYILFQQCQ